MTARDDPAAYQRERRARMRAKGLSARGRPLRKPAVAAPRPAIPLGRELTPWEKHSDAQLEAIEARGGQAVWTGSKWQEASKKPPAPSVAPARALYITAPTNRNLTVPLPPLQGEVIPPPRSMIADGGTPPRRYAKDASVAETTALIRMIAAEQARAHAEMSQRLAALERAKAETDRRLEAIERRRTGIVAVVQGVASLFSLV